jgi:hypothetical protein
VEVEGDVGDEPQPDPTLTPDPMTEPEPESQPEAETAPEMDPVADPMPDGLAARSTLQR